MELIVFTYLLSINYVPDSEVPRTPLVTKEVHSCFVKKVLAGSITL